MSQRRGFTVQHYHLVLAGVTDILTDRILQGCYLIHFVGTRHIIDITGNSGIFLTTTGTDRWQWFRLYFRCHDESTWNFPTQFRGVASNSSKMDPVISTDRRSARYLTKWTESIANLAALHKLYVGFAMLTVIEIVKKEALCQVRWGIVKVHSTAFTINEVESERSHWSFYPELHHGVKGGGWSRHRRLSDWNACSLSRMPQRNHGQRKERLLGWIVVTSLRNLHHLATSCQQNGFLALLKTNIPFRVWGTIHQQNASTPSKLLNEWDYRWDWRH